MARDHVWLLGFGHIINEIPHTPRQSITRREKETSALRCHGRRRDLDHAPAPCDLRAGPFGSGNRFPFWNAAVHLPPARTPPLADDTF